MQNHIPVFKKKFDSSFWFEYISPSVAGQKSNVTKDKLAQIPPPR